MRDGHIYSRTYISIYIYRYTYILAVYFFYVMWCSWLAEGSLRHGHTTSLAGYISVWLMRVSQVYSLCAEFIVSHRPIIGKTVTGNRGWRV